MTKHDEPLFGEMKVEELDYGPSWGVIIFLIIIGFTAVIAILMAV